MSHNTLVSADGSSECDYLGGLQEIQTAAVAEFDDQELAQGPGLGQSQYLGKESRGRLFVAHMNDGVIELGRHGALRGGWADGCSTHPSAPVIAPSQGAPVSVTTAPPAPAVPGARIALVAELAERTPLTAARAVHLPDEPPTPTTRRPAATRHDCRRRTGWAAVPTATLVGRGQACRHPADAKQDWVAIVDPERTEQPSCRAAAEHRKADAPRLTLPARGFRAPTV